MRRQLLEVQELQQYSACKNYKKSKCGFWAQSNYGMQEPFHRHIAIPRYG